MVVGSAVVSNSAADIAHSAGVWTIGVDFGTAYSKAAAVLTPAGEAERRIVPLHIGAVAQGARSLIVPSALFLTGEAIHFGPRAAAARGQCGDAQREMLHSFKTVLAANDFQAVLDMNPPRRVDPDGSFTWRGLLVLYLAYLLELIDQARPAEVGDFLGPHSTARLRYSRPAWLPAQSAAAHAAMVELFAVAGAVKKQIGAVMLEARGLSYVNAKECLQRAAPAAEERPNVEGGLYEASAVAACQFVNPDTPDLIVVADVGAGTSDFAGFMRSAPINGAPSSGFREIEASRRTITTAGDAFDAALLTVLMDKAKGLNTAPQKATFWRNLQFAVRDLKEALCRNGRIEVKSKGVSASCTLAELQKHPDYKSAAAEIAQSFTSVLNDMARIAKAEKAGALGVVLAGGGARFPAVTAMAGQSRRVSGLAINVLPIAPAWISDLDSSDEFAAVFAQMCVCFGAALADPTQFQAAAAPALAAPAAPPPQAASS
jgi:hypothetical protein